MRKRLIGALLLICFIVLGLAGCKKSTCDMCGKEKKCKTYENPFLGEMEICNDCKDEMQSVFD